MLLPLVPAFQLALLEIICERPSMCLLPLLEPVDLEPNQEHEDDQCDDDGEENLFPQQIERHKDAHSGYEREDGDEPVPGYVVDAGFHPRRPAPRTIAERRKPRQ